jgi:maltooligosyltrehalose trehalohydrolase
LNSMTMESQSTLAREAQFGSNLSKEGGVSFRLWAPSAEAISLKLVGEDESRPMERTKGGWHRLTVPEAVVGSQYQFVLSDGTQVPDPASRYQPFDVKGPSEVIDPDSFQWDDTEWTGRPWHEAILYELHLGTFTDEGTFLAAISKLDQLVELGVTGIEIMPVADFPGKRNWGYDGVLLYAPESSYGRPEDFKRLVCEAHKRGLMVILDVVYNHFGPDGNYLPLYAPQIFTKLHKTPWGDAVNYDDEESETVREFVIQNALYWLQDFRLDGLRLDAVHEIKDDGPKHLLEELSERVKASIESRPIHLILENEKNQARRLARDSSSQPVAFTAQWNDDMHHVLHTAATLEAQGYYGDYKDDDDKLGKALAEGFAFQGETMSSIGEPRGEPSAHLPPTAFVAFMQNHDQIGNRAFGERISDIASSGAVRAIAATYLLLPQIPMLFMGEEWCTSKPFPFFCDFEGELGDLVRKGRRDEFKNFAAFQDPSQRDRIPDPQALDTFLLGKLDWEQKEYGIHNDWLNWYKRIITVRKKSVIPVLPLIGGNAAHYDVKGRGAVFVTWSFKGGQLQLAANLSGDHAEGFPEPAGETLWQEGPDHLGAKNRPWSVRWSIVLEPEKRHAL